MIINAKQPCLQRKTVSRQTGLLHFLVYAVGFQGIAVGFEGITVGFNRIKRLATKKQDCKSYTFAALFLSFVIVTELQIGCLPTIIPKIL